MNEVQALFKERLPSHGFATDDLQYGLQFHPVERIIQKAIVQYNWRHSVAWLAYDVDSETTRFDWEDQHAPPPNMLILNPENGHGHLLYGLGAPVHNYSGARDKPLRYMAAIDVAMTETLEADPGYSKLVCKNPLNDRWDLLTPRLRLYDLDELASWLDLERYQDKRRRLPEVGYGRNCTLFERLRLWAYRERRQGYLSEELFRLAVFNHGLVINGEFDPPLPHAEVRATAKSIAKWTWRRMTDKGFSAWQSKNGKRSGVVRGAQALELRAQIVETARTCPTLTQQDIADLHGVTQQCVSMHLREYKRTISDKGSVS